LTARDLHGHWVEATDRGVKGQRSKDIDARHGTAYHLSTLGGGDIMRLQDETGQANISESTSQRDVVHAAPHDVRGDVDVRVVGPSDELTCSCRRGGFIGHGAS